MGKFDTVIAPSGHARSSDLLSSNIINRLIGRFLDIFLRKRGITSFKQGVTILMWILVSSTSITTMVRAECVPLPDCADIGYTATSCESNSLKCPFDTSKLFCIPCDTQYKYTCNGIGYNSGSGTSCGGKYTTCNCSNGYIWNGSSCDKQNCTVGMIYYSDKSCSESVISGKIRLGIVVKTNALIVASNIQSRYWANSLVDVEGVTNYGNATNAKTDYNGKANTLAIVSATPNDTTNNNAAKYCNSYSPTGTSAGQWYLPALGELHDYIYGQYSTIKAGWDKIGTVISDNQFWSSSEKDNRSAWLEDYTNGDRGHGVKANYNSIACFLNIN